MLIRLNLATSLMLLAVNAEAQIFPQQNYIPVPAYHNLGEQSPVLAKDISAGTVLIFEKSIAPNYCGHTEITTTINGVAKKSQIVKDVMLVNGQLTCSSPWFKPKCIISGYKSPNDPGYEQNSSFKLEEVKSDPHEEFLAGESISFRATDRRLISCHFNGKNPTQEDIRKIFGDYITFSKSETIAETEVVNNTAKNNQTKDNLPSFPSSGRTSSGKGSSQQ